MRQAEFERLKGIYIESYTDVDLQQSTGQRGAVRFMKK
jgi:hypothetical protein